MSGLQTINQGTFTTASQLLFYDVGNGVARRASVQDLATVLAEILPTPGDLVTQYASPTGSGFTVTVAPPTNGASMWLLMTPAAGYAAGTVVFPAGAESVNGQELLITSTQSVSTVTWNGNGSSIAGAPSGITGGVPLRFRYDTVTASWYRIV